MIGIAGIGALIAGLYGIVHDQITFALSADYFYRLKFVQFRFADFGLPVRVFVGIIGFLATWWVGLIAGWLLARVTVKHVEPRRMLALSLRGFGVVLAFAVLGALAAIAYGVFQMPDRSTSDIAYDAFFLGVADVTAFTRVAYIHNGGYLGGLAGIITAGILAAKSAR